MVEARRDAAESQMVRVARLTALAGFVPLALVGLVVGALVHPLVAVLGLVVAAAVVAAVVWPRWVDPTSHLADLIASEPVVPGRRPRLDSLLEGLEVLVGVPSPTVLLADVDAANAIVLAHDDESATLVLTRGLVDSLDRLELEGVLAHAFSRLVDPGTWVLTTAAATVGLPATLAERWVARGGLAGAAGRLGAPLAAWSARRTMQSLDDDVDLHADVAAARLTRFPPALATALERLDRADTWIEVPSVLGPLHLLPPGRSADERPLPVVAQLCTVHRPLEERVLLLREL